MIRSLLLTGILAVATAASAYNVEPTPFGQSMLWEKSPYPGEVAEVEASTNNSRATESIIFAYCGSVANAYALNNMSVNDVLKLAIELPSDFTTVYAGKQITAIDVVTPATRNPFSTIDLFVTEGQNEDPLFSQTVAWSSEVETQQTLNFETPFTIEAGKDYLVGYSLKMVSKALSSCYYIPVDNGSQGVSEYGGWLSITSQGYTSWSTLQELGLALNLYIRLHIEGEELPVDCGSIASITPSASTVAPEESFDVSLKLTNMGTNNIQNVEVVCTVDGTETTKTFNLSSFALNKFKTVKVTGLKSSKEGFVTIDAKVTKVNGVENTNPTLGEKSTTVACMLPENGQQRYMVVEEGTGTWCGWCPLGYLALEELRNNPNLEYVIPIAVHNGDQMDVAEYQNLINAYFAGLPSYIVNRMEAYNDGFVQSASANNNKLINYYNAVTSIPSVASIEVNATKTSSEEIEVNSKTTFALSGEKEFRIAYVVREDSVGPYWQTNNLNGSSGFGIFSNGGARVRVKYNDVARGITTWNGDVNSLPTTIEAGTPYSYTAKMSIESVTNKGKFDVIALLFNSEGEIENAAICHFDESLAIEANEIAGKADVKVAAGEGCVRLAGEYSRAAVYTVEGRLVATGVGEASIAVPAGIYVVRADNTVVKVIVK